jgi:hypothetical protein
VLFDHKQTTANLDVLDQLVNQALLARANSAAAQTSTTTSSRAKELLNQVVVELPSNLWLVWSQKQNIHLSLLLIQN